jgi:carbon monoxide dehydrogenase subunit G
LSSALAEPACARYGAPRHKTLSRENSTMDMKGSQRIEAVPETVWVALNDVDVLKACIPGCETINKTSDTEMDAKVTLKIGPVKASFTGKVTLSDLNPPHGYTISGEGSGGAAGHAKGGAKVWLEPLENDATMLHYEVSAAQLGSRLIDATAKKLAGDFFQKFGKIVGPVPDDAPEAEKKGWFKTMLG